MEMKEETYNIDDDIINFIQNNHQLNFTENDFSSITIPASVYNSLPLSPSEILQDETLDIAQKCLMNEPYVPVPRYGPPERGVFKGNLNFEVHVNSSDVHKRKYLYSNKLNRIYVDMGSNFSMEFSWDQSRPLLVRAMAVFSDTSQAEKRVERCLQHKHAANNCSDPTLVHHVLRSTRAAGTQGVYYCGSPNRPDSWYSVLVHFPNKPDEGSMTHSHAYQFVCKNSCSSGINRRSIDIVFTLEDESGVVLGRQCVGARVCACPRRDMVKDEEGEGGKRPCEHKVKGSSKRLKLEPAPDDDDNVYTLPPIQIVGAKTLTTGLTVIKNMMEQMASCKKGDAKAQEKYNKAISSVKLVLDQFKTT